MLLFLTSFPPFRTQHALKRPVHEALEDIITSLWKLREEGGTALGPAMMLAISQSGVTPSSQVVLCTDGLANIGVGSLDEVDAKEFMVYLLSSPILPFPPPPPPPLTLFSFFFPFFFSFFFFFFFFFFLFFFSFFLEFLYRSRRGRPLTRCNS